MPSLRSGVAPPVTVGGENALGHHDSCERNGLTPFQALLRPLRGDEKQGRAGHLPFVQTYGARRTPAGPGKRPLRPTTRDSFSPGGFFSFVSAGALKHLPHAYAAERTEARLSFPPAFPKNAESLLRWPPRDARPRTVDHQSFIYITLFDKTYIFILR